MTRTTVVFALNLTIAVLGLAASATEGVTTQPAHSVLSPRWDDLPEPATETVWCANEDAVYAACSTRPGELRTDLIH